MGPRPRASLRHGRPDPRDGARPRGRHPPRHRHAGGPAAARALSPGPLRLRGRPFDARPGVSSQGAEIGRAAGDRPPPRPGGGRDRLVARIRLRDREPSSRRGPAAARVHHRGRALPDLSAHTEPAGSAGRWGSPGDSPGRRSMMSFPPLEKCLEQIANRYVLVVLAAKRSRQLNRGAQPQVETKRRKWTSVALEECIAGKIQPKKPEEAEKTPATPA